MIVSLLWLTGQKKMVPFVRKKMRVGAIFTYTLGMKP